MNHHPNRKIFLVDDDIFCLTLYKQFLEKLGYNNISSFTSGDDCLENIGDDPHIIFLDYNMEVLNGIEVLKKIRQVNDTVLVYVISGSNNQQIADAAIRYGAVDYIVKSSINPSFIKTLMLDAETLLARQKRKASFFEKMKAGLGIS